MNDRSAADYAERLLTEMVGPGLRKIGPRNSTPVPSPALSEDEQSNLRAKERFVDAVEAAGLGRDSIRELAKFFGVKRSTLYERISRRRTDLAPLPEWFQKLADYADFLRLSAEFSRTA